jgi:iron complex transport system ATP-binding protein
MAHLEARDVGVRRGGRDILTRISFHASSGDFVAVIGANGAGKSTLLSVLSGLQRPARGSILLDGESLPALPLRKLAQRRAYLPQGARCEWPISVERLVALGLTPILPALGNLPRSYDAAIASALDDCDLTDRRHQPCTTLSGGELARAMLARALVGNPDVLIVDEPIAGLDPKHAMDTALRLRKLADSGKLVVASLHDLTLAGRHATHVCALEKGCIRGTGRVPTTLTAELIRSVFDVEAVVTGSGSRFSVDFLS